MKYLKARPLRYWAGVLVAVAVGFLCGLLAAVLLTIVLWGGRPT